MVKPPIPILIRVECTEPTLARLREHFDVHYAPSAETFAEEVKASGPVIRGVITNGSFGVSGDHIKAMPQLEIVLARGVGFEKIDVAVAREQGVVVTNARGLNSRAVADHAMALLMALVRRIPGDDRAIRERRWAEVRGVRQTIYGKRMGVLGFGGVGAEIAGRAAGFDMKVAYHSRTPKPEVDYPFFDTVPAIAEASDMLMVALPGGPETRNAINSAVLEALGPEGYLVNVGRGSVVDNDALCDALEAGVIAGAATDVIDGEPSIPERLLHAPNLLITPHTGGLSPDVAVLADNLVFENLTAHFAGGPIINRLV